MTLVILALMKTAISIPDPVFQQAEVFARKRKMSRSELYTAALTTYLECHHITSITEKLNEVYSHVDATLEDGWLQAQVATLVQEDW